MRMDGFALATIVILLALLVWAGARLLILWDALLRRLDKAKRERQNAIYEREAEERREQEKARWAALTVDERREERRGPGPNGELRPQPPDKSSSR